VKPAANIRLSRADDLRLLPAIEREAAKLFPAGRLANPDATLPRVVLESANSGRLLFVAEVDETVVGFVACRIVDDFLHLMEVSVHPSHSRAGIGRALVRTVLDDAQARQLTDTVITTFADIPWNGPFYENMGFETLSALDMPRPIARIVAGDSRPGTRNRIAMRYRNKALKSI